MKLDPDIPLFKSEIFGLLDMGLLRQITNVQRAGQLLRSDIRQRDRRMMARPLGPLAKKVIRPWERGSFSHHSSTDDTMRRMDPDYYKKKGTSSKYFSKYRSTYKPLGPEDLIRKYVKKKTKRTKTPEPEEYIEDNFDMNLFEKYMQKGGKVNKHGEPLFGSESDDTDKSPKPGPSKAPSPDKTPESKKTPSPTKSSTPSSTSSRKSGRSSLRDGLREKFAYTPSKPKKPKKHKKKKDDDKDK